ncbi:hypothetical protein D9M71_403950 [compost metagenome]
MAHAVQAVVQEGRAGLARQLAQQPVDSLEVFEDQELHFRRGMFGFRQQCQLGQVGLFQRGAAEVVEQQPLGHGGEEGAGFAGCVQLLTAEQTHEGVLAQVFGTLAAGHAALQPGEQPAAMVAVQRTDQIGVWALCRRQAASPWNVCIN